MAPAPRITEFAGYRIEGLLGSGGKGVVYRAEHPRLGATVALKVMDPELAMNETFRERFVREARAAAQIKHPNIVPIYDAGEWQGDLYIAMRYIEGEELRAVLRRDGVLTTRETCVIGAQIASALDAAHRSGLIHRDVKPGNILVEPGPDPDSAPIAYLADLGLTKHVDSNTGITGSGELLGTIDYIAPEQIYGERADGRADIYSLACVLFECLTGTVPYERENQADVLWAHLHDQVPRATSVNPLLSRNVDSALARGMAKSPGDRFSTARELVAALETPLEATTAAAPDGGETRPTRSPAPAASAPTKPANGRRRGKRALALATAVGVVLGGVAAAGIPFLVSDDGTATTPTAQTDPPVGETTEAPNPKALNAFEAAFPTRAALDHARRYAQRRAGLVSFAVVDTRGGSYAYRGRKRYASASVIKAMFLTAYLRKVRAEGRDLSSYERALLTPMIRISDNDAAAAVYGLLGSARVERVARAAGMRFFAGIPTHWASGEVAALDQARFFARLDKLVPRRFSHYARRLLRTIVDWQTWGIPTVARPRGYRVFFKTGRRTSPSLSGVIVHQVARLECRGQVFTLAVLTDQQSSDGYAIATIAGIARRLLTRPC
jgi:Protein kinase domain